MSGLRRVLSVLLKTVVVCAMLVLLLWSGWRALDSRYVYWNGSLLPRDAESLDISGKTVQDLERFLEFPNLRSLDARNTGLTPEQFYWLQENLPRCSISWEVPIQGRLYSQQTQGICVSALTDAELDLLEQLPELSCVDVGSWSDYEKIMELCRRYPQCRVLYSVEISGERWGEDAVSMVVENADPVELQQKLPCLTGLQSVMLTGEIPERTALLELQEAFPDIFFFWKMEFLGTTVETDMTRWDLSGTELDSVSQLREILPYFPCLEALNLDSRGLSPEELGALIRDYPEIRFAFDVEIGGKSFPNQSREIDLSNLQLTVEEVERVLPCFPELEKVVMCQCGIPSEEMDALNKKYEDIRFVWSVSLGGMLFRTDAVHFTPNRWGLKLTDKNIQDLQYCTDMVCVDIGHAKRVTSCAWAANMPKLKYLVLAETGISDLTPLEGLEELVFLELFISKVRDYSPLLKCPALEDLNLCYTYGDPAPIAEMTWLKRLWWGGSWLARKTLSDKLPDTQTNFQGGSSTGRGWREGQHYYDMRDFIGMRYMTG